MDKYHDGPCTFTLCLPEINLGPPVLRVGDIRMGGCGRFRFFGVTTDPCTGKKHKEKGSYFHLNVGCLVRGRIFVTEKFGATFFLQLGTNILGRLVPDFSLGEQAIPVLVEFGKMGLYVFKELRKRYDTVPVLIQVFKERIGM